jgi:hypothetical protein
MLLSSANPDGVVIYLAGFLSSFHSIYRYVRDINFLFHGKREPCLSLVSPPLSSGKYIRGFLTPASSSSHTSLMPGAHRIACDDKKYSRATYIIISAVKTKRSGRKRKREKRERVRERERERETEGGRERAHSCWP